ncbi:MAG: TatD family deoxyribonuclease [Alphaproteobacteria bacterium]|nr:MAG: TatD family deoxyribonuclease [Alphaproteobacteria bacterium]
MLVDSHCHLNYKGLREDVDGAVARARNAGVATMLTINTRLSEFDEILTIARRHADIFCSVGVHPHEAENHDQVTVGDLTERAADPLVVAIGETGLDYYYDNSPRPLQQASFRTHIAAARETRLPVIVHTRDADDDCARILEDEMAKGAFSGVIHCFTASADFARTALDLGLYISISGIVTFNRADMLRDVVRDLPLDRLLVETDAPFLAPVPKRGKTNEPAYVRYVAAKVAEVKGIEVDELARVTTENFFRLFTKATRPESPGEGAS